MLSVSSAVSNRDPHSHLQISISKRICGLVFTMKGNKANTFAACQRSLLALSPLKTGDNVQEKMRQPCVRTQQRRINLCKSQAQQRQASFSLPLLVTFSSYFLSISFFLSDNRSALLARLKSIPNGTLQYCIIPK